MILTFPNNFLWGAASSAEQSEGTIKGDGKAETVWMHWHKASPEKFWQQIGPEQTSQVYIQGKQDISLMKNINMNSYRTSISWARLLPDGINLNELAVKFYNEMIDEMLAQGIKPILNLYHFDTPMIMQNIGGFANKTVVDKYVYFAEQCFKLFGDRVKMWATFNEPMVSVECGYLYQYHYPCEVDSKKAIQVAYNIALASAKAIQSYHKSQSGDIGIILNLSPTYPRSESLKDKRAAQFSDLINNRSFLDPSIKGSYPKRLIALIRKYNLLPEYTSEELDIIANNTIDFLGVNYYMPRRAQARDKILENEQIMPESFYANYEWPERIINPHRGWEIYPQGIYDIAINIKDNYNNIRWFVSENGMGVEGEEKFINAENMVEDDYRIEFIKNHLSMLHKGIQAGSNCFGYHLWCFIDCWSWLNSYKNRYGYYRLDIQDNYTRKLKKSGLFMSNVMKTNKLEI